LESHLAKEKCHSQSKHPGFSCLGRQKKKDRTCQGNGGITHAPLRGRSWAVGGKSLPKDIVQKREPPVTAIEEKRSVMLVQKKERSRLLAEFV